MKTYLFMRGLMLSGALAVSACDGPPTANGNVASPSETKPHALGKNVSAEGVDYLITSVEQRNQISAAGIGPKAEAGETFVVVRYTLKNTAKAVLPLMERADVSLVDGAGTTYARDDSASAMAITMMKDFSGMASDLNPGVSAKMIAVWKVDRKAFDKTTWKLVVNTSPALTFALR
jgi:hypothetical protein